MSRALLFGLALSIPAGVVGQFGFGLPGQPQQGNGNNPFPGQGQRSPQQPGQTPTQQDRTASGGPYNLTTDDKCGCFRTNSSTSAYFAHHHFIDFRSLTQHARSPNVLADANANTNARESADFFTHSNFTSMWSPQSWNNADLMKMNNSDVSGSDATLLMVNSKNNIFIERNTDPEANSQTYMVMRTARLPNFQTSAEIESLSQGFRFISIRMHARTRGAKGAITAMFTYRAGPNNQLSLVQEADLEIRTNDPQNRVQFTNQPSWNANGDIPAATRNVTMPSRAKWNEWATYRMDWTPGSTSWYVDGQLASTITFQAPRDASQIMFNSWSDGGTWSGTMPLNESASLEIQWIEVVFNNTESRYAPRPGSCSQVCSIDETPEIGTPVLIASNTGAGTFTTLIPRLLLSGGLLLTFVLCA
jgi:beta-glucanase (GH16 family)